jgi:uncharacterized protein (DUF58 family)
VASRSRPTRRAFTIAGAAVMLFLAASTAQAGWLYVLAAGVLGMVAASLLIRRDLSNISVSRVVPRRSLVGDDVRVGLVVRNGGKRSLPLMRIEDHYGAFEPSAVVATRLRRGETGHLELVKTTLRRGMYASGQMVARSGAPFGFSRKNRVLDVPSEMTVVPRWVELRSFPILEPSSFPSDVLHERARTGAGQEYMGVREYRPGDPQRAVHWRTTARVGRLHVREFEEEVQSRVTLVLAGGDVGTPPDSAFESLVSAAASIGIYSLNTGHPVDLLRFSAAGEVEHIAEPDRFAILDWLAAAEPMDISLQPLIAQAQSRVSRRGTVVLLIPTFGAALASVGDAVKAIQGAGSRAIVVAARASTWAEDGWSDADDETTLTVGEGRTSVRSISRGEDLVECLG